ncbi:Myb-like, SWIRM and MPN domains 1 [Podila epigama]|nr:Myb-like, SWIRM and MPN domains 1 [Podila epigama]
MAEEEIDIDIDIDIDGDDSEHERLKAVAETSSGESRQDPSLLETTGNAETSPKSREGGNNKAGSESTADDNAQSPDGQEIYEYIEEKYQIPEWVMQEHHSQTGLETTENTDERSQSVIESMLAEELFYSGRLPTSKSVFSTSHFGEGATTSPWHKNTSIASLNKNASKTPSKEKESKKRKSSYDWSGKSKRTASEDARLNTKLSSADLPSHNTRWTLEEDERLREGLRIHGHGNWKAIAAVVGTRNPLQVKNHARHLVVTDKIPHDASTNTSDGEGLDRNRSSAANSEEDGELKRTGKRRPRSKKVKRIDASVTAGSDSAYDSFSRLGRRARSVTSESGLEDFTGSEFGATSGYDTDNDEDRSGSKSPSLSTKASSVGATTPSPGLRPLFASLPTNYTSAPQRRVPHGMDEDEDIDIDVDSSDEGTTAQLTLARELPPFANKAKSRSISPFSNASSRSRLSSDFDTDSDRDINDLDDEDDDETLESGNARKLAIASSPILSDLHGLATDPYANIQFNTSTSSINSTGTTASSFKATLKDAQQNQSQRPKQQAGPYDPIPYHKIPHIPKERRTVSFGAVHVAELQPDITSYDEEEIGSSEDGTLKVVRPSVMAPRIIPASTSRSSLQANATNIEQHFDTPTGNTPTITILTNSRQDLNRHSMTGLTAQQAESDKQGDDEEEEGSLGTGPRKSPTTATATTATRATVTQQKSNNRDASHTASYASTVQQTDATALNTSRPYSPGGMSIAPSLTMSNLSDHQTVPRILDKNVITEEEKRVHSEFFCNKASKTPERYLRIRNTILHAWEESPSTYLTKTSVRSSLRDCGDVNAIGRVHSWLESIGAINVGMTASSPGASLARPRNGGNNSSKRRGHSEERGWSSSSSSSAPVISRKARTAHAESDYLDSLWAAPPIRRRRVRNEKGEWVDKKELEGHVIAHNTHSMTGTKRGNTDHEFDKYLTDAEFYERYGMTRDEMEEEYEQERLAAQNAKYFAASEMLQVNTRVPKNKRAQHYLRQSQGHGARFHNHDDTDKTSQGYGPFRLVPLRKYNQQHPAPFRVKVSSDAMLIMDFHSHLAQTEIIGLLGGLYDEDERILFILSVFPCRSLSTSLQCEIDPVSDIEARSFFSSKGFVVVGWYHSHPTFEPTPSIRDIENQTDYQTMFRRHELGVEPFVGAIVSPFDPRNLSYLSEFQFLSVSEEFDENLNCRLPYCYLQEITRTNEISVSVFMQVSDLVRYYRTYDQRVDLSQPLRKGETITKLEKLLRSLSKHIFVDETIGRAFLSKVQELVVKGFKINLDRPLYLSTKSQSPPSSTVSTVPSRMPPKTVSSTVGVSTKARGTSPMLRLSLAETMSAKHPSPQSDVDDGAISKAQGSPSISVDSSLSSSTDLTVD